MASAADRRSTRLSVVLPNGSSTVSTIGPVDAALAGEAGEVDAVEAREGALAVVLHEVVERRRRRGGSRRGAARCDWRTTDSMLKGKSLVVRPKRLGRAGRRTAPDSRATSPGRRGAGRGEQLAQVVVLREEAVEAVLDRELLAERADRPAAQLAAEVAGALDQGDVEATALRARWPPPARQPAADDHHALRRGARRRARVVADGRGGSRWRRGCTQAQRAAEARASPAPRP